VIVNEVDHSKLGLVDVQAVQQREAPVRHDRITRKQRQTERRYRRLKHAAKFQMQTQRISRPDSF